jgi:hypothetical protein
VVVDRLVAVLDSVAVVAVAVADVTVVAVVVVVSGHPPSPSRQSDAPVFVEANMGLFFVCLFGGVSKAGEIRTLPKTSLPVAVGVSPTRPPAVSSFFGSGTNGECGCPNSNIWGCEVLMSSGTSRGWSRPPPGYGMGLGGPSYNHKLGFKPKKIGTIYSGATNELN